MRFLLALFLTPLSAGAAVAAPVAITVAGADGKPLAGAVVQIRVAHPPALAGRFAGPFTVAQKDIAFQPHVLIVPVGASVSFPNRDKVRHHVYSFSAPKRFELKLYGQQETRSIVFDQPGIVALGCNIHDSMSGFIIVTDTPFAATTDAAGRVAFADVPAGAATVSVWHPSIRAPGNVLTRPANVAVGGLATTFSLARR